MTAAPALSVRSTFDSSLSEATCNQALQQVTLHGVALLHASFLFSFRVYKDVLRNPIGAARFLAHQTLPNPQTGGIRYRKLGTKYHVETIRAGLQHLP